MADGGNADARSLHFTYAKTPPFINDPFFDRGVSPDTIATLKSAAFHQQMIEADPEYEKFHRFLKTAQDNLKKLADAGVKYGIGTDSGPPDPFPGILSSTGKWN